MVGGGGGRLCPLFPLFSFQKPTRQHENHMPLCSSSIISPPPPVVGGGFLFKRGCVNHTRCPCFFSFRTGAAYSCCCPFLSVLNGGSVNPIRCPLLFFHFEWGRWYSRPPHFISFAPPIMGGISSQRQEMGGSVKPTRHLHFFSFTPRIQRAFPLHNVEKQGQHETHMPPPFFSFTPPHWGGIYSCIT
jgi:hypothetical protein